LISDYAQKDEDSQLTKPKITVDSVHEEKTKLEDDSPLVILKNRLAKGEISIDEFNALKKEIESNFMHQSVHQIDDVGIFSRNKDQNNAPKHRKRSVGIGVGIGIAVAVVVLLLNIGDLGIHNNPLTSQLELLVPTRTYKINTDCELIYFIYNGPKDSTLSFMQSPEEFQKKYPEEFAKLKKLAEDPKFIDELIRASQSINDPFDKVIYPYEMREIMSSIIIKEFSINPKLKDKLTLLQGIEITTQMYLETMENDPKCAEKMRAEQMRAEKDENIPVMMVNSTT
jgi:hypothetical protein